MELSTQTSRATDYLRALLPPGATLLVTVTRVNQTGSARWVRVAAAVDGEPMDLTYWIALAREARRDRLGAIYLPGGGVNPGVRIAADLGRELYSDDQTFRIHSA